LSALPFEFPPVDVESCAVPVVDDVLDRGPHEIGLALEVHRCHGRIVRDENLLRIHHQLLAPREVRLFLDLVEEVVVLGVGVTARVEGGFRLLQVEERHRSL
jgi:hypothetical protein